MKKLISHLLLLASFAGAWIACAQTDAGSPGQPVDNTNAAVATTPGTNAVPEGPPAPTTNAPVEAVAVPPAGTNDAPPGLMLDVDIERDEGKALAGAVLPGRTYRARQLAPEAALCP